MPSSTDEATGRVRGFWSTWSQIIHAAGAKVIVMGVSAVFGLITTRLILQHFGTAAYAQYGLLATFTNLIPFADLGIGAAVLNAVGASDNLRDDVHVRRTITTAIRVLCGSAAVLALTSLLLQSLDLWPVILGDGLLPGGGVVATLCLVIYALILPFTVGQRVVVGMGRSAVQVLSQGVVAPAFLLAVVASIWLGDATGTALPIWSYVATSLITIICIWYAWRATRPLLRRAFRDVPRLRQVPNVRVGDVAWPQLIQSMVIPIGFQLDRILLSHLSADGQLAEYNLAAQLFNLITQTVMVAGIALWPHYAKRRARGVVESPFGPSLAFGALGLGLGLLLTLVSPWLFGFLSDGQIAPSFWTLFGFVAYSALVAVKQPLGTYMTDPRGMRAQIGPVLLMVPLNLGLAYLLIGPLGAGGPKTAGAISMLLCQVLPYAWWIRRDLARRRAEQAEAAITDPAHPAEEAR